MFLLCEVLYVTNISGPVDAMKIQQPIALYRQRGEALETLKSYQESELERTWCVIEYLPDGGVALMPSHIYHYEIVPIKSYRLDLKEERL